MGTLRFFSASEKFISRELVFAKNKIEAESDYYMQCRANNQRDKTSFKAGVMNIIENFIVRIKREKHYLMKNDAYNNKSDKYNDSIIEKGVLALFNVAISTKATKAGLHFILSNTELYFQEQKKQGQRMVKNILPKQFELKDNQNNAVYSHMHPYLHANN